MTDEFSYLAKSNKCIRKYFLGTFPADVKPHYQNKKVCCWVWNTDESDHRGEQLVVVFKNHSQLFFFDSFGKSPQFYNRTYWIHQQFSFIEKNNQHLQSEISIICGGWCLYYLHGVFTAKIRKPTLVDNLF